MPDIVVSCRAQEDFKRIWHFIALDSAQAADRLLLALEAKIERLRDFPQIGTSRDDIRPGARTLIHGRYLVLYEHIQASDLVEIVPVVEAQRDLGSLF